jgi:hypothetical protein
LSHLQLEQLGERQWLVARLAVPAQAQGSAKTVARRAASFTNEAVTTLAALVHGVGHQRIASTQFSAESPIINGALKCMAQPERALAAGQAGEQ